MRPFARILSALAVLLCVALAPQLASAEPGDEYTISVLTMSPGDPVFFKFGHIAILVHDSRYQTHAVYNWGTFSFDEPGLIPKFLKGRLSYWLSVQDLESTLAEYDWEKRWVVEQELNLSAAQKLQLVQKIRRNARPENRKYRYDYYLDNCSTRVRDVVDDAIGGRLHKISGAPAPMTFRGETSRLTADSWWAYLALNMSMGSFIDQPVTEWEEMFVPGKVQTMLRKATVVDNDGNQFPLVKRERQLVASPERAPELTAPPNRKGILLAAGVLLGAFFGWLGYGALPGSRPSGKAPLGRRLAFGLPLALFSFFCGVMGSLFLFLWLGTDHKVAYHNENLLQLSPIALALFVVAIGLMLGRRWAGSGYKWLSYGLAAMSVLGLLLKALPWFKQINGEIIALFLPIWVGLAVPALLADRARAKQAKVEPAPVQ